MCGAIKIKSNGPILNKVNTKPSSTTHSFAYMQLHTDQQYLPRQALCHCLDCRKITSSTYSTNIVVPNDNGSGFSVTQGTPREFRKAGDSGNVVTRFFCGDCGSSLWSQSATYGETRVIKAGILDVVMEEEEGDDKTKPLMEIYVRSRVAWREAVEGAVQHEGHP